MSFCTLQDVSWAAMRYESSLRLRYGKHAKDRTTCKQVSLGRNCMTVPGSNSNKVPGNDSLNKNEIVSLHNKVEELDQKLNTILAAILGKNVVDVENAEGNKTSSFEQVSTTISQSSNEIVSPLSSFAACPTVASQSPPLAIPSPTQETSFPHEATLVEPRIEFNGDGKESSAEEEPGFQQKDVATDSSLQGGLKQEQNQWTMEFVSFQ